MPNLRGMALGIASAHPNLHRLLCTLPCEQGEEQIQIRGVSLDAVLPA
jgi:hypothetical protein